MINMTVRWGERFVDINFPCGDDFLTKRLMMLDVPGDLPTDAYVLCVNKPKALACLEDKILNMDEINFLAKRISSFDAREMRQFLAAAQHEQMCNPKDLINLTYSLSRYTVVQDLSSMAAIGKQHLLNLNGYLTTEQQLSTDFEAIGRNLVRNNNGVVTEHGLLFKNDTVPFQQEYDGQHFPYFEHGESLLTAEMQFDGKSEFLYLPCDAYAIAKAAERLGAAPGEYSVSLCDFAVDSKSWYDRLSEILEEEGIFAVNRVCHAINVADLDWADLETVMQYAERTDSEAIVALARHIDNFIVIPGIYEDNEVAEFFLDNIFDCELPTVLEEYLDMCDFGEYLIKQREGKFIEEGFVCMEEGCSLQEILGMDDQAENQTMQL